MHLIEKRGQPGTDMKSVDLTTLTISSRNYSSWSMRGWLLAKLSGLPFETVSVPVSYTHLRAHETS